MDPTSGRSAIIDESASSPSVLTTSGVIQLTGASGAFSISVSDPTGTLSPSDLSDRFSAVIVTDPLDPTNPKIDWTFKELKSDFGSLAYGQSSIQNFIITLSSDAGSTTIPVKVSVFDANNVVDVAPVATSVSLAAGTEDTVYTINAATLLTGVTDVDTPHTALTITAVSVASGGGVVVDNHDSTFTYTPALHYSGPVTFNYTASDGTLTTNSTASLTVTHVDHLPTGTVTISGTAAQDQVLTASNTLADTDGLGAISYQWQRDGGNVAGAIGTSYTLGAADVGHTIDVVASYTDGGGTLESVASNPTAVVSHVDHLPTGTVTISGTAAQDQVLTASNTLADTDGLGAISYQWQRDGGNVAGATGTTYTLGAADVGHTIDVVASYTDGGGTLESVASNPTAVVSHVDHLPTGTVTISGTAAQDQVLTASNTLADTDGLGAISYQWQRDGGNVTGATGTTYTLGVADVGHSIDVVASYTDGGGTLESVASNPTATVTHVDHLPTGTVTIGGTAAQDQVLTVSNTLADADGLGAISYQWQRDGSNVTGATGTTYTLGVADVGHSIDVVASYTDGGGTLERVASNPTATVTHVDHLPTGTVTISGTAAQDQVLTASNTLADTDGLGAISYQWQRDGGNVAGATGATYTLGVADVGHSIDVVASYTDGGGTLERVASNPTATVTHVDHPPVIDQGPQTVAVADGGTVYATGHLTATDPDAGDTLTWTINGGTRVASENYQYGIDEFSAFKTISGTVTQIFDDTFTGTAPPAGPSILGTTTGAYSDFGGAFVAGANTTLLEGSNATAVGLSLAPATYGDTVFGQFATLLTGTSFNSSPGVGLRSGQSFAVNGLFDLTTPSDGNTHYGIRLSDRVIAAGGSAFDQPGTETVDLAVVHNADGSMSVQLNEINFETGVSTNLETIAVVPQAGDNEILLTLSNAAATNGQVQASFTLEKLVGGAEVADGPAVAFTTAVGRIFDNEDWTRAQVYGVSVATPSSSPQADSILQGTYGSLDLAQNGTWQYNLNPGLASVKALAAGEVAQDVFHVTATDSGGLQSTQTITVNVTGTNDAPTISPVVAGSLTDTPAPDTFPTLTGQLVGHDVDDDGETASLTYAALDGQQRAASTVVGQYGTLTVHADGSYVYVPNSAAIDALPAGNFVDTFTVQTTDIHGATGTAALTVNVTGVNDAPVITGDVSAAVTEGQPQTAIGHLVAADAEGNSVSWQVVGGSTPAASAFSFAVDNFEVTVSGSVLANDPFTTAVPPTSGATYFGSPGSPLQYFVIGGVTGANGEAILDAAHAAVVQGATPGSPAYIADIAGLLASTSLSGKAMPFSVTGRFDLTLPTEIGAAYGIRLDDSASSTQLNEVLELVVTKDFDGVDRVELRDLNFVDQTVTVLGTADLGATAGSDQIELTLSHAANAGTVTGSFDLISGGVAGPTVALPGTGNVFPDGNFTNAEIVADAPQTTYSYINGICGTLAIDQSGQWTYALHNDQANVQALTAGQVVHDPFVVQASDGHGGFTSQTINVQVTGSNDALSIAGDLSVITVRGAGVQLTGTATSVTTADLQAVDPDSTPDQLVFTVTGTSHGHVASSATGPAITSFTQAQLNSGAVFFVADSPTYVGQGSFAVSLSDGIATAPTTVGVTIVDAQISVVTAGGYDFNQDNALGAMGSGVVSAVTPTTFTITNAAADRDFTFSGTGFVYDSEGQAFTAGTITSILETTDDSSHTPLASFGLNVSVVDWMNAAIADANGDQSLIQALSSPWTFNFIGGAGADAFKTNDQNDIFTGKGGNDTLNGGFGYDRANYGNATAGINVQLADGIVTGDASVGTDTLQSIELVTGSNFADTFDARGFSATSTNAGSTVTANTTGQFNEFEGRGGNDTIFGNGQTRISYYHATAGVTVTLTPNSWTSSTSGASGTATGDASVGTDTFTGVNNVRGSFFNDTFTGSTNPFGTAENFEGLGGNDIINGGGGFDRAIYDGAADGIGITVNLADGTVTGGPDTGTDTLISIEGIYGTEFADTYNAGATTLNPGGFSTTSTNAGSTQTSASVSTPTNFNEFEGGGGNDTVTGNGNTRVAYYHATGGVVVTLGANGSGTATGNVSVGHDTFVSGVNAVNGSEFNDIITGNGGNNVLNGEAGNDVLIGNGGNDTLTGGTGSDIFVFSVGVPDSNTTLSHNDIITDFTHSDGDRIDLRSITSIHSLSDILSHGAQSGSNTVFTFTSTDPTSLTLQNVTMTNLTASDFIFAGQVAVTVQTPDGYDFSTLYDDMAASNPIQAANNGTHVFAVDAAKGITFEMIGTGFTYDSSSHLVNGGTITEIDILDTADPTQTTQDHVLVNTNGWSISASALFTDIGAYAGNSSGPRLAALNGIFNAATYSIVGSDGTSAADGKSGTGADVFFGGDHADVFNGMPGPFGSNDPGNDTVDYSHATAGVIANLFNPASNSGAAAGDIYISIENLRGTAFDDTLAGDGNNNVLEGGLGNNIIDGGGGSNTASYEHATAGVTVSLMTPPAVSQNTGGAGTDTLFNIQNLLGSSHDDTLTGNGNSVLEGGPGNDILIGQGLNDTASYEHATAGVTVNLATAGQQNTGGAGTDTLTNIANLMGSHFNDTLTGNTGNNTFFGNGGTDTFVFNETLGGIGHDTIGDFNPGQDHIQLDYAAFSSNDPNGFNTWLSSHATTVNGSDVLIDLNVDGSHANVDTILLKNVALASLQANDFVLHPGTAGA